MKIRPITVGITGGIGAGKTIVCDMFKIFGVSIYPADERAKYLMNSNINVVNQIKKEFGPHSYTSDGLLDRYFLANSVFNDTEKLRKLNGIVHPAVKADFEKWSSGFSKNKYVLKEAALLVETGSYKDLDFLVTVVAPESVRINRVLQRDPHRTIHDVQGIISNQLAQDEKAKLSKFVIVNDEQTLLIPQILEIHEFFINFKQIG